MNQPTLLGLYIGMPKNIEYKGKEFESGIRKVAVKEAFLTKDRFIGDDVANHEYHGGRDRAVLLYSDEHYKIWEKEYGIQFKKPAFGENLSVRGMVESNVYIGDIYQVGDTIIQITQARIPCDVLAKNNYIESLYRRIVETGYTGMLARVLQEGIIREDSKITLLERHPLQVSALYTHQVLFNKSAIKEELEKILQVTELAEEWQKKLKKKTV
ncbi:MOSC domain-containing protein [Tepidibacillus marianensis]|uniref:MOSC domain-containing protein n=1 Tax=Tepidibacillus marianensis TaxID=3131995 RepID=UPI0030CE3D41